MALVDGAQKICQEERAGDQSVCAAADQNGPRLLLLGVVTADADKLGAVVGVDLLSDGRVILCRVVLNEGLVITPPFGYWKDRNTNQVLVQPEAAETVRLIYALYLRGCGQFLWTYASVKNVLLEEAYWNGSRRVEYVCRGYQRNGKGYCSSHRIREEVLDKTVWDYTKQKEILRLGQKIDKLVMEKIRIQQ